MSENNVKNNQNQGIPAPPKDIPAEVPNLPTEQDLINSWKTQKSSSGAEWKVSKTYDRYKDKLINYLQVVMNFKTNIGLKRKAASEFLKYSTKIANQFEAISKKQPLAEVSDHVKNAKVNLGIVEDAINKTNFEIKSLKDQIKKCEEYATITTMDNLSKNDQIARRKSFGRGWLPENHANETLYQIKEGKSAGGQTKDQYKLDILETLGISPDYNTNLFYGFDAKVITLGELSSFFSQRKSQLEGSLKDNEINLKQLRLNKITAERNYFIAQEDIKLAKSQMSGDFNNRVRKAFRLGNEVLGGNLFNLLISNDWSPIEGQTPSEYSKPKTVNVFSKLLGSSLVNKLKAVFSDKNVENDSNKELTESIQNGKDDTEDWRHLSKLWPGYVVLDKLLTSNYAVALIVQGSLDDQTFAIKQINKNIKVKDMIAYLLDARCHNAQSQLKECKGADAIERFLVSSGLSPKKGPFLVETHKLTGKPVLSPTVIDKGGLDKKTIQDINNRLGLTSIEEEDKAAKSKK